VKKFDLVESDGKRDKHCAKDKILGCFVSVHKKILLSLRWRGDICKALLPYIKSCLPTPVLSGSGHEGLDLSSSSPSTLAIITLLEYNVKWIIVGITALNQGVITVKTKGI
jgi:hypothetical protein